MNKKNIILIPIAAATLFSGCEKITQKYNTHSRDNTNYVIGNYTAGKNIQEIYNKSCASCHGRNGERQALQKSDIIGGQDKEFLLYELQEYKAGRLNQYEMGGIMKNILEKYSQSDLEQFADYISKLSGEKE